MDPSKDMQSEAWKLKVFKPKELITLLIQFYFLLLDSYLFNALGM